MSYNDLVTYEEVKSRAMESDRSIDEEQAAVVGVISSVSASVESYLNRTLIATAHTQEVYLEQWQEERIDDTYSAWAEQWPVTEVQTTGYEGEPRKIYGDADDVRVDYIAGFRREDQALSDVQQEVPAATVEPEPLPGDIADVTIRLVLYYVGETADATLGIGQKEQAVGTGNALTVRGRDPAFVAREMGRLDTYKRRIHL
jgi:hypothetical protein